MRTMLLAGKRAMLLAGKRAVHTVHSPASISLRSLSTPLSTLPFSFPFSQLYQCIDSLSLDVMPLLAAVSALLPGISSYSAFLHRHWRLQ